MNVLMNDAASPSFVTADGSPVERICAQLVARGKLNQDGVERAIEALERFRVLCRLMGVTDIHALATAAGLAPNMAVPTRTMVAPSFMADL